MESGIIFEEMRQEGIEFEPVFCVRGGVKNPAWLQIIADITGRELLVPREKIGAFYGDDFMAAVGLGFFDGTKNINQWNTMERRVSLGKKTVRVYKTSYKIFRELYERNKDLMRQIES